MSKSTYPLKLPTSIKKPAAELAATDGVSLNQFIAAAVAEKVGSLRTAREFLRERAGSAARKAGARANFLRNYAELKRHPFHAGV